MARGIIAVLVGLSCFMRENRKIRKIRWGRVLAGGLGVAIAFVFIALATLEHWYFAVMDPGAFDAAKTPPVPDYKNDSSWAALPNSEDDADVFVTEHPATKQESAKADVFFLHPTTAVGKNWNAAIDDPNVVKATVRGATLIQASAFNACCAVYAPRYRQANGQAFAAPSEAGNRAIDIAFSDVSLAFDEFLRRRGTSRPFVLASHSQGSVLAERLLREKIWGKSIGTFLVAGYLIGGPITRESLGADVTLCDSETQTECVVAFNVRGPRYRENNMEFKNRDGSGTVQRLSSRLCVNPLSWRANSEPVPATRHAGALFFDTEKPQVLSNFADATCFEGRLLVQHRGELPYRDIPSAILLRVMGPENYHPIEYQLFYLNLRQNAVRRVDAYLAAHGP